MKCELCHKADAETAITRGEGETAEELYVCQSCAKAERQRRQKKSLRTRKVTGLPPGMSMSVTEITRNDGDADGNVEPPPFFGAIMNAIHGMMSEIEQAKNNAAKEGKEDRRIYSLTKVDRKFLVGDRLHLEGLHLIGELEPVKRALRALKMELEGVQVDGVNDAGHVYTLSYAGSSEQVDRVLTDLLREERNARVRLYEEMQRVFGDALCRALAIMKNCRLLAPAECFDLLSPLRLAAQEKLLDGITLREIEKMMSEIDLSGADNQLDTAERDLIDAERADEMNRRFEDVVLNERAEEQFI